MVGVMLGYGWCHVRQILVILSHAQAQRTLVRVSGQVSCLRK